MICRRCGSRIPEHLAVRESFKCPECGRQFGTPAPEREIRYESADRYEARGSNSRSRYAADDRYEARSTRYSDDRYSDSRGRYAADDRYEARSTRYSDDRYSDSRSRRNDRYYDDQYEGDGDYGDPYAGDGYYDDGYADDGYYDDQYSDDGYYDDQYAAGGYDDGFTDEDLSDLIDGGRPRPAGMKLTTVLTVVILGILAVAGVYFVHEVFLTDKVLAAGLSHLV